MRVLGARVPILDGAHIVAEHIQTYSFQRGSFLGNSDTDLVAAVVVYVKCSAILLFFFLTVERLVSR